MEDFVDLHPKQETNGCQFVNTNSNMTAYLSYQTLRVYLVST